MKNNADSLGLDSKAISALPIINRFIERIELKELLSRYFLQRKIRSSLMQMRFCSLFETSKSNGIRYINSQNGQLTLIPVW